MSLTSVKMSEEVWLTCLTHALSTETEEIMGLLLGDIQRMTVATGRTTRVIGWYHSHPHITVLPSHVDVRTQAMYQLLDSGFIGLIFSCFNEDAHKVGRIQVIAFQSLDGKQNHMVRPVSITPSHKSSVINLESSLNSSENASTRSGAGRAENLEQDTGVSRVGPGASKGGDRSSDLGGFFANADANHLGRGNHHPNNLEVAIIDIDPMDMSEGMQEAMHRSSLEMSDAEYVRKEIPLHVLPTSSLLNLDSPLTSFTDLQHVLYEEEHTAYKQPMSQNMRDGKAHPLTFIHHTSTYQASMCKLMEYCLSPAINGLQDFFRENEIQLAMLTNEAKILETEALRGSKPSSVSPRNIHRGGASSGQRELYSPAETLSPRNAARSGSHSLRGS